ncbi:hypothetical protein [Bradyrhizobium sp. BWC-3-1]|jgi:hypothetical protein|nr:hypothetical protein [Bradyrhizobium sp. BWC-3-1]WOH55989.1 hypothetical protein RX329_27340 [Bradyrhizobium sp. BWC-3-1]
MPARTPRQVPEAVEGEQKLAGVLVIVGLLAAFALSAKRKRALDAF